MLSRSNSKISYDLIRTEPQPDKKLALKMSNDTASTQDEDTSLFKSNAKISNFTFIQSQNKKYLSKEKNIQFSSLYEIYCNLLQEEQIHEKTLKNQKPKMNNMRKILIEYLQEVVKNWGYSLKSFFTCISILDCYLSKNDSHSDKLQLIGITCLLIAAKFHEVKPNGLDSYVFVCDGACDKEDIMLFELKLLQEIDFKIISPTSLCFYEFLAIFYHLNEEEVMYGEEELLKFSLNDKMLLFSPSVVAEATILMVIKKFDKNIRFPSKRESENCMTYMF